MPRFSDDRQDLGAAPIVNWNGGKCKNGKWEDECSDHTRMSLNGKYAAWNFAGHLRANGRLLCGSAKTL